MKLPSWPRLASLGNNKIVRSSYIWVVIIPIFAKILNYFPDKISISFQNNSFLLDFILPFSWKLLFFSSLFFAIATLIFYITCPPLIKNFMDVEEFKRKGLTKNQLLILFCSWIREGNTAYDAKNKKIDIISFIQDFNSKYGQKTLATISAKSSNSDLEKIIRQIELKDNAEIDAYWLIRSIMSNTTWGYRLIISFFYLFGFILLGYILCLNTWMVIKI